MSDKTEARLALEARAKELDVDFAPNIGDEKLRARVDEAETKAAPPVPEGGGTPSGDAPTSSSTGNEAVTKDASEVGKPAATAPAADPGPMVTVIGPRKGRWRAGRHFTREAVDIPLSELAEAELEALKGDPCLMVKLPDLDD